MQILGFAPKSLFILVLCGLCLAPILTGCGNSDEDVQAQVNAALRKQKERESQKKLAAEQIRLKRELRKLKKRDGKSGGSGGASSSGSSTSSCGGGVSVNSVTSCPFARNIAVKFRRYGSGSIKGWSPALSRYVYMNCTGGSPATCTGGNGAVITIR